jgi:hypothetical protein
MANVLTVAQTQAIASLTAAVQDLNAVQTQIATDGFVAIDFSDYQLANALIMKTRIESSIADLEATTADAKKAKDALKKIMERAGTSQEQADDVAPIYGPVDDRFRAVRVLKRELNVKAQEATIRIDNLRANVHPGPGGPVVAAGLQIKLPQLVLPKFSGDPGTYQQWIEVFKTSVHEHPGLATQLKFAHLRSLIGGEAQRVIENVKFDAEGYRQAMDLLEKKYGKKPNELKDVIKAFQGLDTVNSIHAAKKFAIDVELLCRQLQQMDKSSD